MENIKIMKPSIICDKKGNLVQLEIWHKIRDEWVYIVQIFEGEYAGFYTDGVKENNLDKL